MQTYTYQGIYFLLERNVVNLKIHNNMLDRVDTSGLNIKYYKFIWLTFRDSIFNMTENG